MFLGAEAERLLEYAQLERVTPQLKEAVDDGALVIPQSAKETLGLRYRGIVMRSMILEAAVADVGSILDAAGIGYCLLKGQATGRTVYPAVERRECGDVDILVSPADFERVIAALRRGGSADADPPAFGPMTHAHRRAHTLRDARGVEIDVHRSLRSDVGHYEVSAETVLDGCQVGRGGYPVPADLVMLCHASLHLLSRNTRLSSLLDVAAIAAASERTLPDMIEAANELGCSGPVSWALRLAGAHGLLPSERVDQLPSRSAAERLAAYYAGHGRVGAVVGFATNAAPGARLRTLAEIAWPSEEFLSQQARTRGNHLARLAQSGVSALTRRSGQVRADQLGPPPNSGTGKDC